MRERQYDPPQHIADDQHANGINSVLRGVSLMQALQPQRSCKSATAGQHTRRQYNSQSSMDQWLSWCEDNGIVSTSLIPFKWVRANAPHKSFNNKSLGVMLKDDCIHVKDWTTGQCFTFFDDQLPTTEQSLELQAEHRRLRDIAEAQRLTDQRRASVLADTLWHEAIQAPLAGYFISKGLSSTHGAKWHQQLNCWLIRVVDIHGNTLTLQKIYNQPSPNKFYLQGGRTRGAMVSLGSIDTARRVLVVEGYSTACTLREETGETVIAAMNGHNLKPVCEALRECYSDLEIIVCGDDDHRSDRNTGRTCAEDAARSIGCKVCFPTFCEGCSTCSDFNDAVACNNCQKVKV